MHQGDRVLLVKPTTFMNLSGRAVTQVLNYFQVDVENTLVVCDDFNLPFGSIRFRAEGSDGGHNGIRSVIYELQTEAFSRLRFGIGDNFDSAVQHVLTKFTTEESEQLKKMMKISCDAIECWIAQGIEKTMNNYNGSYMEDNSIR